MECQFTATGHVKAKLHTRILLVQIPPYNFIYIIMNDLVKYSD